jgi:ankyrin repeat protein
MAKLLYQNGADVNTVVKSDEAPLIYAFRQSDFNMVEFLVKNGANVNLAMDVLNVRDGKNNIEYRSLLNMEKSSKIRNYLLSKDAVPHRACFLCPTLIATPHCVNFAV